MAKKTTQKKKASKKKAKKNVKPKTDWSIVVSKFLSQKAKTKKIEMGSPGSAQVTRIRLLDKFGPSGLTVATEHEFIILKKQA